MTEPTFPVCIVGIGARTPLGLNAAASAAAVRGSISAIGEHPYMVDKAGELMSVAMDRLLTTDVQGVDRFHDLALPAMAEALGPLVRSGREEKVPVFIGLPEARPGRPAGLDQELCQLLEKSLIAPGRVGPW